MPVSLLKPMKGIDHEFKENLLSFCRQEYPEYEVLLGFSGSDDGAAAKIRESVIPSVDSRVRFVTSGKDLGANRKVSNLQGLVDAAHYQLLAISDSDMRADSSYLLNIVTEYFSDRKAGLVTCLYKITRPVSLGSGLESLAIALDFIPSVLVARRFEGVTFGLGASMLVSKQGLSEIGGLQAIADYLADDYQLGNRLWKKGYRIVLSRVVLETITGPLSIRDHVLHQLRWARTYRASRPRGYAGYGVTHIVPGALLLLILSGPNVFTVSLLGAVLLVRLGLASVIYTKVIRSRQWLAWLPLFPIKDLFSFGIWVWSFFSRTVTWRGRSYIIGEEGKMVEKA
jgi:ceramide glucosyltransferase